MKKTFFACALVLSLLFVLFPGCSNNNPSASGDPTSTSTPPPAAPTYTPTIAVTHAATIYSDTALDGYVDEGGGYNNTSSFFDIGDATNNALEQGGVSFALPGSMTGAVTSAVLWVYLNSAVGSPLSIGEMRVAHITPNYTSGTSIPYLIYSANTTLGTIINSVTSGWYQLDVTAAVENDRVNSRVNSQFRLYCNGPSDYDLAWDIFEVYSGDSGVSYAPKLVIQYND